VTILGGLLRLDRIFYAPLWFHDQRHVGWIGFESLAATFFPTAAFIFNAAQPGRRQENFHGAIQLRLKTRLDFSKNWPDRFHFAAITTAFLRLGIFRFLRQKRLYRTIRILLWTYKK